MNKIIIIILLGIVWNSEIFTKDKVVKTTENSHILTADSENQEPVNAKFTERFLTTSVIIGEAVILLFILYYWKKTRDDGKIDVNTVLKRNIKALRNERVMPVVDRKSSKKREKLVREFSLRKISGKIITSKAKKFSVSKGELFLAARIQQLSN